MRKLVVAGLLALPLLLATDRPAAAQAPCPNFGCGGFCMNIFGRIHQNGPLFNYGPYSGYYPFEPYGPWTADLRYNPPPPACKDCHKHEYVLAQKLYAAITLQNVWKRLQPLTHSHHGGCANGNCGASADSGPTCTLCGKTAQAVEGKATLVLTGSSQ